MTENPERTRAPVSGRNPDVETLAETLAVSSIKHLGPQKLKQIHVAGLTPRDVLTDPDRLPIRGKRAEQFRGELEALRNQGLTEYLRRAERQLERAETLGVRLLTYSDADYPRSVFESNYPIPVVFALGNFDILRHSPSVACVGSRAIRAPYSELHRNFAVAATLRRFSIVSGFAMGADSIGHKVASEKGGRTICVMPSGLDRPFPPENRDLWRKLLHDGSALMVSEYSLGTAASSLTLRKRNKLIVSFSAGALVSQSSATGGAMNAFRFCREQKKPVATFRGDGKPDTSGNTAIEDEAGPEDLVLPSTVNHQSGEAIAEWLKQLSL